MQHLSEKEKFIENDYAEMWISEGILFGKYKRAVIVDRRAAEKVLLDREILCDGKSYPVIANCRKVKFWTLEGRKFHISERNYRLVKAEAIIYPDTFVARIFVGYFRRFHRSDVPTEFFLDESQALVWIKKYRDF